ncbi:hypothetical protein [Aquimarina sp. I32.4]|uniref:hypothetical protein n=1 Tax=Aquimarina sp. I32.4 TaxID=2053903 RepID=UPI000CDE78BE|nr:hypothetical protein [Aquimarina sp. I32.4]
MLLIKKGALTFIEYKLDHKKIKVLMKHNITVTFFIILPFFCLSRVYDKFPIMLHFGIMGNLSYTHSKSTLYTYKERPLDSLYDFNKMQLSDYYEILQKNGKMDMYGFSLEKGDYLVMVPPYKRNSEGWWGVYRPVKERWIVVAGDL